MDVETVGRIQSGHKKGRFLGEYGRPNRVVGNDFDFTSCIWFCHGSVLVQVG